MTGKIKTIAMAAGCFLAGMLSMIYQQHKIAQLRAEVAAMQKSHAALETRVATLTTKVSGGRLSLAELVKGGGRNQVDVLRDTLAYVNSLKPGEIGAAMDALRKMPDSSATWELRELLLSRWGDEDPTAAIAWVKNKDSHYTFYGSYGYVNSYQDYYPLFRAWAAKDPTAALAGIKQVGNADVQSSMGAEILGTMSLTNPQGAMDLLHQMPAGQQSTYALSNILGSWALVDPAAASAAAFNLPATEARNNALASIAGEWAELDPQAALDFANSLPAGRVRERAVQEMMWSSKQDLALIANTISAWPDDNTRNDLIRSLSWNWAMQDPAAALTWIGNIATGRTYDQAVNYALQKLDSTAPTDAAAFIGQMADASTRDGAITQLAGAWAQSDLDGALTWAQALPATDGKARGSALNQAMANWETNDPTGAAAYIDQNLRNDPNFNSVANQLANKWVAADPSAALAWASSLPPGQAQTDSLATIFGNFTKADPTSAWAQVQQLPDGEARNKAMGTVVSTWSNQDPAQAAAQLGTLPAGVVLDDATSSVASNWVSQNPADALQWVGTLPAGSARDGAVSAIIDAQSENDLPGAFALAASIGDPTQQENHLNDVVSQWAKKDLAAATSAVESATLTDQQRTNLLKTIEKSKSAN